jgi:tRNA pseudouridine55 synthase
MNQININGWLFIDKPVGMTSTKVGVLLKRQLSRKIKIGHVGTLDPLASGVLPVALGEATKLIPYFNSDIKQYDFHITFGQAKSTDDAEGQTIAETDYLPSMQQILKVLEGFHGEIRQVPPIFSAIKIQGIPCYKYARQAENIAVPERLVTIFFLKFNGFLDKNIGSFSIRCSSGTYVRAIARDLAVKTGSLGYVSYLRRVSVGKVTIDQTISLEKILQNSYAHVVKDYLLPIGTVLDDIPAVTLAPCEVEAIKQGKFIKSLTTQACGLVSLWQGDDLIAIANVDNDLIKPKRVFNQFI